MKALTPSRWALILLVGFVFGGFASATGVLVRGKQLEITTIFEPNFPTNTTGQIAFMGGMDAGVPYWSEGDGGPWQPFVTQAQITAITSAHLDGYFAGGLLAAGTVVTQTRMSTTATFNRLTTTINTAGSDGAHTFTVDVFDKTDGGVLCVTGAITCNTAASSVGVACTLAAATADDVQLRVNDANCTVTAPLMNIAAEYR